MFKLLRPALIMLGFFTLLTGMVYPLAITGIAQAVFPIQANGSLIYENDRLTGSGLIGQPFTAPGSFWGRPSAAEAFPNQAVPSTGANYGPTNPEYLAGVAERVAAIQAADPENDRPVPVDLITPSGSGLDPHISLAAAYYQVGRVAAARGLPEETVRRLVDENAQRRWLNVFGEPRVNVLQLNLALDRLQ